MDLPEGKHETGRFGGKGKDKKNDKKDFRGLGFFKGIIDQNQGNKGVEN
jgi:hypothetical protein